MLTRHARIRIRRMINSIFMIFFIYFTSQLYLVLQLKQILLRNCRSGTMYLSANTYRNLL